MVNATTYFSCRLLILFQIWMIQKLATSPSNFTVVNPLKTAYEKTGVQNPICVQATMKVMKESWLENNVTTKY